MASRSFATAEKKFKALTKEVEVIEEEIKKTEDLIVMASKRLEVLKQKKSDTEKKRDDKGARLKEILELERKVKELNEGESDDEMEYGEIISYHPFVSVIASGSVVSSETVDTSSSWADKMDSNDAQMANSSKTAAEIVKARSLVLAAEKQLVSAQDFTKVVPKKKVPEIVKKPADFSQMMKELKFHCQTCCTRGISAAKEANMKYPSNIFESFAVYNDFLRDCETEIKDKEVFLFKVSTVINSINKKISTNCPASSNGVIARIYTAFKEADDAEKHMFFNTCCSLTYNILGNDYYMESKECIANLDQHILDIFAEIYCSGKISCEKKQADRDTTRFVRMTINNYVN